MLVHIFLKALGRLDVGWVKLFLTLSIELRLCVVKGISNLMLPMPLP
ncbi:hypothetical protein IQ238_27190 [Pleurocapsales cyanobacterium LEGE 06147]|nr:hypothetical protein [Pleurocapsales cyanobacterium LEGE 06147]